MKKLRGFVEQERRKSIVLQNINTLLVSVDAAISGTADRLKQTQQIEEEARKMRESALEAQTIELAKKQNLLKKKQRLVGIYFVVAFGVD